MSSLRFDVEIDDSRAVAAINAIGFLRNPQRVLDRIGNDLTEEVRLGFANGRGPNGEVWPAPKFRKGQPLRDTGRLMNSITHRTGPDYIEIGTSVKYAAIQQFGGTIRPKRGKFLVFKPKGSANPIFAREVTIPARPFLPVKRLPAAWLDVIVSRVNAAIEGAE